MRNNSAADWDTFVKSCKNVVSHYRNGPCDQNWQRTYFFLFWLSTLCPVCTIACDCNRYTTLWNINVKNVKKTVGVLVNERQFRRRSRWMIVRCCTVLDPSLCISLSGVLNDVFVSGLLGLVDLSVHSQWSLSSQYARALICRSCAYGRCFLFPECFSESVHFFPFAVYLRKFRHYHPWTVIFVLV